VIMDIYLRDKIDGIEAAEQIYTRFGIPVVLLSAYSDNDLLQRAKLLDSFGYLIKPYEERELYTTLEMAIFKAQTKKECKQIEVQLQKAHKIEALGTLAGGIAHDFNNLLYVILGNISLVENDLQNDGIASKNLKAAEKACLMAKELTNRLITFSKGGAPIKETIPIDNLVIDIVTSAFANSAVKPEFFIPDDLKLVEIDISQIQQVMTNIAVNAEEAMDNQGVVKVYCENVDITEKDFLTLSKGEYVKISFEDHGCGISKQNLDKVFDPYFSTRDMGANKAQGLGLAICHSIITRHNGLITIESESGTGSTFSVYLPAFSDKVLQLPKSKEKFSTKESIKQPFTSAGKILLMDDEESIRMFMTQMLNRLGYGVETCIEGKEAVGIYKKAMESKEPFDLAILDLTNQFGMGGQETMRKLLEIDPDTQGIIITGYSNDPVVANYKAYGFSGY
ncbi:MAG: response regulator, partial [Desulfobacteraceae bacterium]|nr:response regulator [Desulfobacteraceae bacterium]